MIVKMEKIYSKNGDQTLAVAMEGKTLYIRDAYSSTYLEIYPDEVEQLYRILTKFLNKDSSTSHSDQA